MQVLRVLRVLRVLHLMMQVLKQAQLALGQQQPSLPATQ
jgi:hypothetical protein